MYVCMYVCIYLYIYQYTHMCRFVYVCVCMHVSVCVGILCVHVRRRDTHAVRAGWGLGVGTQIHRHRETRRDALAHRAGGVGGGTQRQRDTETRDAQTRRRRHADARTNNAPQSCDSNKPEGGGTPREPTLFLLQNTFCYC